jgi:hypothetical protein
MDTQHQAAYRFGYRLHHSAEGGAPAPYWLDVVLREKPTGEHFDPQEMHLPVTHEGEVFDQEITPHIPEKMAARAVAGPVELRDRFDEAVTFFTFGGDLKAHPEKGLTFCTLTSPAPIVHLDDELSSLSLLGVEGEAMLARRRAAWGGNRAAYEARLAKADPLLLYVALLKQLEARFEHFPPDAREEFQGFINYLHTSLRRLRRSPGWPVSVPAVEDLL